MQDQPIILTGHSHATALGVFVDSPDFTHQLLPIRNMDPRFVGFTGAWPREAAYWADLAAVAAGRNIAILWDGNQYNAMFLFRREPQFDIYLSEYPDIGIDPDCVIVPQSAVKEKNEFSLNGLRETIKLLRSAGPARILVVGTPPPKGDDNALLAVLGNEPYYKRVAEEIGVDWNSIQLTPRLIRWKLWKLIQTWYREISEDEGVAFLPVPDTVLTDDGFLRPEFWADDATHANAAYGYIMLERIAEAFKPR